MILSSAAVFLVIGCHFLALWLRDHNQGLFWRVPESHSSSWLPGGGGFSPPGRTEPGLAWLFRASQHEAAWLGDGAGHVCVCVCVCVCAQQCVPLCFCVQPLACTHLLAMLCICLCLNLLATWGLYPCVCVCVCVNKHSGQCMLGAPVILSVDMRMLGVSQASPVLGLLGVQGTGGSCSFWLAWPIPFPGGLSPLHVPCQQSHPSQQAACLPPLLAKFGSLRSAAVSGSQSHGGPYIIWLPAPPPDPQDRASHECVPAHAVPCACSAPTMFLVLVATEELKEFFAKARAGSVRLIKVVIEDGECFL